MKKLLLGNEAVARGLFEAGVRMASSYPGTPSTEITEAVSKFKEIESEWAPNEKVACEVSLGASLAGGRSFCAMKHVGLNVAADPLFTASYTGVNAGMVICVADDPGMHSSQNEQDSRHYAIAAKIPMLEPADSSECKEFVKIAYELSEKYDTPVMIRLTTRIAHSRSLVNLEARNEVPIKKYEKNEAKNVMIPGFAKRKHPIAEKRTEKILKYCENTDINYIEYNNKSIGIIAAGDSYEYAREVLGEKASYLKLGMVNPLPIKLLTEFADNVEKIYVVEELDDIIETHCKKIGITVTGKDLFPLCGEFSQETVRKLILDEEIAYEKLDEVMPQRPPAMCCGCPHRGLFYALKKEKVGFVSGDIGCYTLAVSPPISMMDTCICMGASISALHGFNKVRKEESESNSVAVLGDSTFIHSGITGLIDVVYNQSNSVVIILDNSITGMTGHQQNPATGYTIKNEPTIAVNIEKLCESIGVKRIRVCDPYNLKETQSVINEELNSKETSVIISRRPCALLKGVKKEEPLEINKEKCIGCKACLKIGCPAISIRDSKAVIDTTQCVGCGVCSSLCPKEAIAKGGLKDE